MKSIVVPVNFTANSANAARYAADLALAIDAEVQLIYVFQVPVSMSEVPMPENVFEELQGSGLQLLQDLSAELTKRTGGEVKVGIDLQTGTIENSLERFCEQKKPFMVVMGATEDRVETLLLGSSTVRAVKHIPYPVLVVPAGAAFHLFHKIVIACDREDLETGVPAILPFLAELGELPGARIEVLHVLTGSEESSAEGIERYNSWKGRVKGLAPELHFVRESKVESGIYDYLQDGDADLLMVFPKSHSFFEFHRSHARRLVLQCPVPVVSLHE